MAGAPGIGEAEGYGGHRGEGEGGDGDWVARAGIEGHRFSTITFPSCGASKFHGATDIAAARSVRLYM